MRGSHREGYVEERQSVANTWCCWQRQIVRRTYFCRSSIEYHERDLPRESSRLPVPTHASGAAEA